MAFSPKLLAGEELTKENFKAPSSELGILPFWFWNGELDVNELEWQLREYHSKGIPGVFIHGRFGLKVPYVSDQWFEKVKFVVEKAKEIGIATWVYDEMNWPSGTAERQVLKKYPHLTQRYLELVALRIDGPQFTFLEATDSRYVNTGDSHPIAAFGCTEEEYQNGITNLIDLTQNLSFEKVLPWEAPAGKWRLLYFLEKEVPYYIDALDPESTKKFLEITHDRYYAFVGKHFGSVVPGFFTDEPAMHYYQVGVDNYVVPWSKQMFKIFRQRRGYDLRPYLPALYVKMGEKTAQIRYDFWRTLSEQYSEAYYKQIRDWCDKHGVIFTGHLLFEEWIRYHARCEGNIFSHLKHMHLVGVDHLYPKIGTEKEPEQHVAMKIGSSAAHHYGSTRLLCESMGGSYWDCTLERMKWIANWEYVLGVNLFNNHGYHYSIEGERKRDWPPSQFYHHTWWKYYQLFTSYMARLSHVLSGGRHVAKVLVLYPLNSIWTNYVPQQRDAIGDVIERDFNYLTDTLLRLHFDFDYVDEETLQTATIREGRLCVANEEYFVLILPPVTHIRRTTFDVMRKFLASGGNIIGDTLLPVEFLEASGNRALRDVKTLFGLNPMRLLEQFKNGVRLNISFHHRNSRGNAFVFEGKGLYRANAKKELRRVLTRCIEPDVTISDENVFYLHRIKDGHDLYFFVNTTQQEKRGVEITFENLARPELWDANTGDIVPIHVYQVRNKRLVINLDFPPSESRIVVLKGELPKQRIIDSNMKVESLDGNQVNGISNVSGRIYATISSGKGLKRMSTKARRPLKTLLLGKEFSFDIEDDNVLAIGKWKMTVDDSGFEKGYFREDYNDRAWLNVTNGAWETQLPQERDASTYPVTLWYRTSFHMRVIPPNTRILIDGFSGKEYRLFVNGHHVSDRGKRSKLDAEIKEIDIQPFVHPGRNVVAVQLVVNRRTEGILDLLKIIGDFALQPEGKEYVVVERVGKISVGDWTKQGYPFYSGTGVYRTDFDLPSEYLSGRLFLEVDCGEDILEIEMNGDEKKVQPWHPHAVDVTGLVRPGQNTIELKVTNTLINMLEAVQKPSGIFSPPRLVHHHRYSLSV